MPLLPSGRWQPDCEQSVDPAFSWFSDFFSMEPRYEVPDAWQPLHQPAPLPIVELWFILSVSQLVVLLWQALQSMVAPPNSCVASGIWLAGLARAPWAPADK